jgi:hypothetical protein
VIYFLKILLRNAGASLWQKNSFITSLFILASITVLGMAGSSSVAATQTDKNTLHTAATLASVTPVHILFTNGSQLQLGKVASKNIGTSQIGSTVLAYGGPSIGSNSQQQVLPLGGNLTTKASDDSTSSSPSDSVITDQDSIQLAQPNQVCQDGQAAYAIASSRLTLQHPPANATTVQWYWETRVDSGTDATDTPPIADTPYTRPLAAATAFMTIDGEQPTESLVLAPTNADYSYSLRLHLTSPIELTSQWIHIPQVNNSCS